MKQIIKKLVWIVIVLLIVLGSIFGYNQYKEYKNKDRVLATSNYGNVYKSEIINYLKKLYEIANKTEAFIDINKLEEKELTLIVNELVNQKKLLLDAKHTNIMQSEEYKQKLNETSESLLISIFLKQIIDQNITEELLKEKYNLLVKESNDKKEYKVKHILVAEEKEIDQVITELKTNSFDNIVKKYSIDQSKENGGDLGFVMEGQTVPEFNEILLKQPINKVSNKFKTQFGWHVLIKTDERKVVIPEYKKVKDSLKNALYSEQIKEISQKNIENANVKILK